MVLSRAEPLWPSCGEQTVGSKDGGREASEKAGRETQVRAGEARPRVVAVEGVVLRSRMYSEGRADRVP